MTDEQLIKKYLSGDTSCLEILFNRHLQSIFSSCYRVCLDSDDANDITQNVLLKIMKNLHKFSGKSEFKTWYYRIAYNESITFLGKKKGYTNIEDIENSISIEENFGKIIDHEILKNDINKNINALPLIERNIILYFYYDDLKIKEIAKIVQLNENTVKTKLSRAKKILKPKLKDYESLH